jgi:hypothetical protein
VGEIPLAPIVRSMLVNEEAGMFAFDSRASPMNRGTRDLGHRSHLSITSQFLEPGAIWLSCLLFISGSIQSKHEIRPVL